MVETTLARILGGRRSLRDEEPGVQTLDESFQRSIWYTGAAELLQRPCVAVVGTREPTPEGAARARRLARELATAGVVVVSGLAQGVDTEALTSAMESGGKVIGVIGTPLDQAYPIANAELQERIAAEHLLVSQFRAGTTTFPSNFPERNRLMAAVSDATVVIEASEGSGTLHQVIECVRLGRWVFIAKSVLDDPSVRWPADFQKYECVKTLRETADILAVLKT